MKKIFLSLVIISQFAFSQSSRTPFSIVDSLIRPADYTPYTAGDALNDSTSAYNKILIFTIPGGTLAKGEITEGYILCDTSNSNALRLHLYSDSTGIERTADNAAIGFTGAISRIGRKLGYINITTSSLITANRGYGEGFPSLPIPFRLTTTASNIYGVIEVVTGFTPQKNCKFYVVLKGYRY